MNKKVSLALRTDIKLKLVNAKATLPSANNHSGGCHTKWTPPWNVIMPSLHDAISHINTKEVGQSDSGIQSRRAKSNQKGRISSFALLEKNGSIMKFFGNLLDWKKLTIVEEISDYLKEMSNKFEKKKARKNNMNMWASISECTCK